jgi:carbon monoxide dehydrogenase subunit G
MIRLEGTRDFTQAPDEMFAHLIDPAFLVGCVPDVDQVKQTDADGAVFVIRPGFAFVRGTLETTMRIVEKTSPSAKVRLQSKGIGSSSTVEATFTLAAQETGTRVNWVAEVTELGGLLKMIPSGLVRGAAQKVIGDVFDRIAGRMASS